MQENEIDSEPQATGKIKGIIVSIGAFAVTFAALRLLAYVGIAFLEDIGWVWMNALTYAVLLVIALLFAIILRRPMREVFPIRKFEKPMFFGSLFTFLAVWCFSTTVNSVQTIVFPGIADELGTRMFQLAEGTPYLITLLSIAVLPGIFEELLCRGTMLHALRPIKREWIRIIMVGVMFGMLHGLSSQIAYSIVLGAGFAYIVLKTSNLLYPILWHFVVNSFSVTMYFVLMRLLGSLENMVGQISDMPEVTDAMSVMSESTETMLTVGMQVGVAFISVGGGVLFLYGGVRRLNRIALYDVDRKKRRRVQIAGLIFFALGLIFMLGSCAVAVIEQLS